MSKTKRKLPEPSHEREDVWADTKAAVNHYARNPCAATEHEVAAALRRVRELEAHPAPGPGAKPAKEV